MHWHRIQKFFSMNQSKGQGAATCGRLWSNPIYSPAKQDLGMPYKNPIMYGRNHHYARNLGRAFRGTMKKNYLVVIIGSGFGGLAAAHELQKRNIDDFLILERNSEVGGVWWENKYPGVECDVESHLYSFSFHPNPNWTRHWASGPEILDYMVEFAEKFDIKRKVRFNTTVKSAHYHDDGHWTFTTQNGQTFTAKYFISAVGQQNTPKFPKLIGRESFKGKLLHSARWDSKCRLKDKNVAVIGNAASAVQLIPKVAEQAKKLYVFQRSPSWIVPKNNRDYSEIERKVFSDSRFALKAERKRIRDFGDDFWDALLLSSKKHKKVEAEVRAYMEQQIRDPKLRKKLIPNYPLGTKRILMTDDYLSTFARENVELITTGVERLTKTSIVPKGGRNINVDVIICATGFNSTAYLSTLDVSGKFGLELQRVWRNGLDAEAYLGTMAHGFPNMFMLFGPNTGLGSGSIVDMIEAQCKLIGNSIDHVEGKRLASIEVKEEVQRKFNARIYKMMEKLVWASDKATSWYKTEEGKVTTRWPFPVEEFEKLTGRFNVGDFDFHKVQTRHQETAA
jgi:cation diffusion facilitator CzcD-associated flavoprotein CzcO